MRGKYIKCFVFSLIIGVVLLFRFGSTSYAADPHKCIGGTTAATELTASTIIYYNNQYYYLNDDVTLTSTINISKENTTICLNGHVLQGDGTFPLFNITSSSGSLIICDCQHNASPHTYRVGDDGTWVLDAGGDETINGGVITNGGGDGAICISEFSTLTLKNVNVIGNKGKYGAIYNKRKLFIDGCNIIGNGYANGDNVSDGGGIYNVLGYKDSDISTIKNSTISYNIGKNGAGIYSNKELIIENVVISNNKAIKSDLGGGGIYLNGGLVTIKGSTIQNNTVESDGESEVHGAGIYCNTDYLFAYNQVQNTFTLGGSLTISDNTINSVPNNIYLGGTEKITLNSGVTATTPIGIRIPATALEDGPFAISYANSTDYSSLFTSEDSYSIIYDERIIKILNPNTKSITFMSNGGRGTMKKLNTEATEIPLPRCTFLPRAKTIFAGWSETPDGPKINTSTISLSGNITLYALWKDHPIHTFNDTELTEGITRTLCECGYKIIRFK